MNWFITVANGHGLVWITHASVIFQTGFAESDLFMKYLHYIYLFSYVNFKPIYMYNNTLIYDTYNANNYIILYIVMQHILVSINK